MPRRGPCCRSLYVDSPGPGLSPGVTTSGNAHSAHPADVCADEEAVELAASLHSAACEFMTEGGVRDRTPVHIILSACHFSF